MKTHTFVVHSCFVIAGLAAASAAQADVVTDWNSAALNAIRVERTAPPVASRALAILHASIYDAVNGIARSHDAYFVRSAGPARASRRAAASAAAHTVLVALFPARASTFDALHAATLASIDDSRRESEGVAWGESVARQILTWRANDNATASVPAPSGSGPGAWQPTLPALAPYLLPQWGSVTPFTMPTSSHFRPAGPTALDSEQYLADYEEVKALGAAMGSVRTPEQTTIALFWADGAGTETPPGHWNSIAQHLVMTNAGREEREHGKDEDADELEARSSGAEGRGRDTNRGKRPGNTLEQNARLFALLNLAMADAAICAWDAKFTYNFWRPVTAIRNGDADGVAATTADPEWTSFIVTPPFPDYVSGHSAFSGAAATVLALFYGTDRIAFTTGSDFLPGVTRSFRRFSAAAAEAALSRLYGGIHFRSANTDGLSGGIDVGKWAFAHYLRPKKD